MTSSQMASMTRTAAALDRAAFGLDLELPHPEAVDLELIDAQLLDLALLHLEAPKGELAHGEGADRERAHGHRPDRGRSDRLHADRRGAHDRPLLGDVVLVRIPPPQQLEHCNLLIRLGS